jgi:hypothetical protein
MKKYLICPGYVASKYDRDRHYMTADQLMRHYGVKPEECVVFDMKHKRREDLIELYPDYHGRYKLPTK